MSTSMITAHRQRHPDILGVVLWMLISTLIGTAAVLCPGRAAGSKCADFPACGPSDVYEFGVCKRNCLESDFVYWCPPAPEACCVTGPNSQDGCEVKIQEVTWKHQRRGCDSSFTCAGEWVTWATFTGSQSVAREVFPCSQGT